MDGSQLLSNFISSISVALQIKARDLDKLLPLLPNGDLTFPNLSSLFAAARLMRKLKLKVEDFIILIDLTGINPYNAVADTLAFFRSGEHFS